MAAPKGNKHALGNEGGRPPRFDLDKEAEAFIEWADQEDSLVLRLFAAIRGYFDQSKLHQYSEQSVKFRQAFNYARLKIGARREQLLLTGKGHPAPFQRYAALYDSDLKEHEKELKKSENEGKQFVFIPKLPFDVDDNTRKN